MIYNYKPLQYFHTYRDGDSTPLYHFGFGFSYSTFRISAPELSKSVVATDEPFEVSVTVTNESGCAGTEVVQLYIRDLYSSVTRPVKEFARVELEQGDFEILAGSSSRDCDLQETTVTVK